jgi:hypothetical protein
MTSTHVNDPSKIVRHRASGYIYGDGKLMNGVRISPAAHARADVGIRTTALDLAKWEAALNDTRLLSRNSLNSMFSRARVNEGSMTLSGLGWWLNPVRGRAAATHGGAFRTGFNSTINRYLDDKLTVIVLTNVFRAGANDAGHIIAGFYDTAFRPIASMVRKPDPVPERTAELRNLLKQLSEGAVDLKPLSKSFPYYAYEPGDWEQLTDGMRSISFVRCERIPRQIFRTFSVPVNEICFYKIETNTVDRYFSVSLQVDGKIIYIEPYEY